jgi:membrane protease YdiL (CAAX protease family)
MKNPADLLYVEALFRAEERKPTLILLMSATLLTLHRYFGSIEFAKRIFPATSDLAAALFMFASAFVLMGLIPLAMVFSFRESPKSYGLALGDWKMGLAATVVLFILIAGFLLYPSSQTEEMRAFYPFDKAAGSSTLAFLKLEIPRGLLFYTAWEFFFRGFMLFGLRSYVGDWLAICIQTVPSCLWHIGMPTGEIFSSIAGGILFGILAIRTNSILWPLLLHYLIGAGLDFFIVTTS